MLILLTIALIILETYQFLYFIFQHALIPLFFRCHAIETSSLSISFLHDLRCLYLSRQLIKFWRPTLSMITSILGVTNQTNQVHILMMVDKHKELLDTSRGIYIYQNNIAIYKVPIKQNVYTYFGLASIRKMFPSIWISISSFFIHLLGLILIEDVFFNT